MKISDIKPVIKLHTHLDICVQTLPLSHTQTHPCVMCFQLSHTHLHTLSSWVSSWRSETWYWKKWSSYFAIVVNTHMFPFGPVRFVMYMRALLLVTHLSNCCLLLFFQKRLPSLTIFFSITNGWSRLAVGTHTFISHVKPIMINEGWDTKWKHMKGMIGVKEMFRTKCKARRCKVSRWHTPGCAQH